MSKKELDTVMKKLPEDPIYHSLEPKEDYVHCPTGSTAMPNWAPSKIHNFRGLVKPTTQHYLGIVQIGNGIVEALIDTGGARCMIDVDTAKKLGLEVEIATKEKNWGSYFGPGE
jgi:predicted aspartyl protease